MGKYDGHTPGPWRVLNGPPDALGARHSTFFSGVSVYAERHDDCSCRVNGRKRETPHVVWISCGAKEEDAILAADAPMLLAQRDALAEALRLIVSDYGPHNYVVSKRNIEEARAALAALDED